MRQLNTDGLSARIFEADGKRLDSKVILALGSDVDADKRIRMVNLSPFGVIAVASSRENKPTLVTFRYETSFSYQVLKDYPDVTQEEECLDYIKEHYSEGNKTIVLLNINGRDSDAVRRAIMQEYSLEWGKENPPEVFKEFQSEMKGKNKVAFYGDEEVIKKFKEIYSGSKK